MEFGELGVWHLMKQSIPITATYCANLPHCLARFLFWLVSACMNFFSEIILVHAFFFWQWPTPPPPPPTKSNGSPPSRVCLQYKLVVILSNLDVLQFEEFYRWTFSYKVNFISTTYRFIIAVCTLRHWLLLCSLSVSNCKKTCNEANETPKWRDVLCFSITKFAVTFISEAESQLFLACSWIFGQIWAFLFL